MRDESVTLREWWENRPTVTGRTKSDHASAIQKVIAVSVSLVNLVATLWIVVLGYEAFQYGLTDDALRLYVWIKIVPLIIYWLIFRIVLKFAELLVRFFSL